VAPTTSEQLFPALRKRLGSRLAGTLLHKQKAQGRLALGFGLRCVLLVRRFVIPRTSRRLAYIRPYAACALVGESDACFGRANMLYSMKTIAVPSMIPPKAIHIRSGRCMSRASLP